MNQPDEPDTVNPQVTWDATIRFRTPVGVLRQEDVEDLHTRIGMVVDGWRDEHGVSRAEWLGLSLAPAAATGGRAQSQKTVRLWSLGDPEPADSPSVRDSDNDVWGRVSDELWACPAALHPQSWRSLLRDFGPVVEVLVAGKHEETFTNANPNVDEPTQNGTNRTPQRGDTVRHTTTRVTGTLISLGSTQVGGGDRRDHWAILDTDTALVHPVDDLLSIEIVDRKMEA